MIVPKLVNGKVFRRLARQHPDRASLRPSADATSCGNQPLAAVVAPVQGGNRPARMGACTPSPRRTRWRTVLRRYGRVKRNVEQFTSPPAKRRGCAIRPCTIAVRASILRCSNARESATPNHNVTRLVTCPCTDPHRLATRRNPTAAVKTSRFPAAPPRTSSTGSRVGRTPTRCRPRRWSGSVQLSGGCPPPECRPCHNQARSG